MTTRFRASVYRVAASGPDDISGVEALIAGGLDPHGIVAVLGKTEGNGCVNDFTRGFATATFEGLFARLGVEGVSIVMSGGTEGALSPHWTIFAREQVEAPAIFAPPRRSLAIGVSRTADLLPEHLGRKEQVDLVAQGVRAAMANAGIDDPADVHFVQIKCPLLTSAKVAQAQARGKRTVIADTLKSMGYSRGASALGVAVALGELGMDDVEDTDICRTLDLYSARASTSAGVELADHEIIVLGMSDQWTGPFEMTHTVMWDAMDAPSVRAAWSALPLGRLAAVLAKAEPDPRGTVRGRRHIMLDDSDISGTRHARAFVGGVLAGVFGETELYVSGGAEHQGPPGGGPVAIIVEREEWA